MDFGILGPLEVWADGKALAVRGARRRALLTYLLVHNGASLSLARICDDVWDRTPPPGAAGTVKTYVSQLRKLFAADIGVALVTRPPGYALEVPAQQLDAARFEDLRTAASAEADQEKRLTQLDAALGFWRGSALVEFVGSLWADVEATRLEALRLSAQILRFETLLDLGRDREVLPELERLVLDRPLDEGLAGLLALARYRVGGPSDALRTVTELRRALATELGVEPGAEIHELERRVLDNDPTLRASNVTDAPAALRDKQESLPTGTVTLLFTDLEGSTRTLEKLGEDRFDSVRDEHDVLVGGTIAALHGLIVKHTGDGYMAAFSRAADAVGTAAEIQRLVSRRNEGSEVALGVRIGISAGDVTERAGDYHGAPVVEAARLCAAAAAGQILASTTVRSLVGSRGGHDFVALGDIDLKGLAPISTVAVRWAKDAPVRAPPGSAKGNLPASVDKFIGRQSDIDAIRMLLEEHRLVTLTGPGGSGKTRLALEVARTIATEHADGSWLVDLASIDDETLVAAAAMGTLGLRGGDASARDALTSHLAGRDTLLFVDNCEHVLGGAATLVADLLAACPLISVIATSREPMRLPGEVEYAIEGLGPEDAAQLFAARVPGHRRLDNPGAIERICTALDGIPLALELAAAKLRVLSLAELTNRLDDQLAVLAHGRRTAPDRQRTLRSTLNWSYELLDEDERVLFRRLGIFVGGFTPDAAEQVVADDQLPRARVIDLLEQLVERSLLTMVPAGAGTRFRLLEPIRQYAAERLDEAGDQDELARRHLAWVSRFARQAFVEFFGDQRDATIRISEEHPNVCQALEFAIHNDEGAIAARIIDALGFPWYTTGQPDACLWCQRVLAQLPAETPRVVRAGVLVATAIMLQRAYQHDEARSLLLEARDLYRGARSARGEAWVLTWLGLDADFRSANAEARTLYEEALSRYRECNIPAGAGWCLALLALVELAANDDDLARQRAEEAVQLGRSAQIGQVVSEGLRVLAMLDLRAGDFENADRRVAETIAINEASGDRFQLLTAHALAAETAASRGDVAGAASHLATGAEIANEIQASALALESLRPLATCAAYVAYLDGRAHDAAVLFGVRLGSPVDFPLQFRPILEELEKLGLRDSITAGTNLTTDQALQHVIALASERLSAPA